MGDLPCSLRREGIEQDVRPLHDGGVLRGEIARVRPDHEPAGVVFNQVHPPAIQRSARGNLLFEDHP